MSYNSPNNYTTSNGEVTAYITRTNLYTDGGEYTLPNGKNYVGFYHIHPEKGPMVGATHTNQPHDILISTSNQSAPAISSVELSQNIPIPEYSEKDQELIPSFNSVSEFRPAIDRVEFSVYNEQGLLETINYNFKDYSVLSGFNPKTGVANSIEVDPGLDLVNEGFSQGFYQVVYNFLRDKAATSPKIPYFIQEISADRTELRLASNTLTNAQIQTAVDSFVNELEGSPFFEDFFLNFGDNNLATGIRIALDDETDEDQFTVLIKLYEALPSQFGVKDTCWVDLQTAEAISFDVEFSPRVFRITKTQNIKGPNFEIKGKDSIANSTTFQDTSNLVNTILTSSFDNLQNILNQKGAKIDLNYEDFDDFVFFSSAQSRLDNFYIKVKNIEDYNTEISDVLDSGADSNSMSSSVAILRNNITNIVKNFDDYERFLYFTSGSDWTWPKSNTTAPYDLESTSSGVVTNWLGNSSLELPSGILGSASLYDADNLDRLVNSLPNFVKDDSTNTPFFLFMDMVGQHFDVFWTYTKAIGDRYDADNRLDKGISKDIVADAIRSMGVSIYQNNFSSDDLYSALVGINASGSLLPPTGSEVIENYITASSDITKLDDVNKETYKRIFHNLPFLLKTKGTVTGLRALINTYGIPDTILRISEFGGKDLDNTNDWDYYQSKFNYGVLISGSSTIDHPISASWVVNSKWNSYSNNPETVLFRFKPANRLPENDEFSFITHIKDNGSPLVPLGLFLAYTGSGYESSSAYSGSIPSASNEYATLNLRTSATDLTSVVAPFYDGNWWGVQISRDSGASSQTYTLRVANQIYNGNDGFEVGFTASNTVDSADTFWANSETLYLPVSGGFSKDIGSDTYVGLTGSYQELRYYNETLSEEIFHDFVMNPYSIEGLTHSSSADHLIFRAPLGSDLNTNTGDRVSIHPRVTGSYSTSSFASDSDYHIGANSIFADNTEFIYYDQPAVGIKNRISEKVRIDNLLTAPGNVLTPYRTIQQRYANSESYTRDINYLEVAFSPQNEINDDINSSFGYFSIGDYIGDPLLTSQSVNSYAELDNLRDTYFEKYYKAYDWHDYVRLIKYFDNSLFKMIKDFVPAKTSVSTGVVIKQHILERNRQRPAAVIPTHEEYTGSITKHIDEAYISSSDNIANRTISSSKLVHIEGGQGGLFDPINVPEFYSASFSASLPINQISPQITQSWSYTTSGVSGSVVVTQSSQEEFYTGELSGTEVIASDGELNTRNPLKSAGAEGNTYYPVDITGDGTNVKGQTRIAYNGIALGPFQWHRNRSKEDDDTHVIENNWVSASLPLSSSYNSFTSGYGNGSDENGNTPSVIWMGKWYNSDASGNPWVKIIEANRDIRDDKDQLDTIVISLTGSNRGNTGNYTVNQITLCPNAGAILGNNPSGSTFREMVESSTTPYLRISKYRENKFVQTIGDGGDDDNPYTGDHIFAYMSHSFYPRTNDQNQDTIVFHSCSIVDNFPQFSSQFRYHYGTGGGVSALGGGDSRFEEGPSRLHVYVDVPVTHYFPTTRNVADISSATYEDLKEQYNIIQDSFKAGNATSGKTIIPGYTTALIDFNDNNLDTIYNTETGIADKGGFLMFNNVQDEAESYLDIEFGDVPGSGQREIGK